MSVPAVQHFLLVFDHRRGELVDELHFGHDSKSALAAYSKAEDEHRGDPMMEIVLIGSDSIETVKVTLANYYGGIEAASKYLIGI